jgi:feruloyl esterase
MKTKLLFWALILGLAVTAAPKVWAQPTAPAGVQHASDAQACAALSALRAPDLRVIESTLIVPSPSWAAPPMLNPTRSGGAMSTPFCRVQASVENEIEFETWLPLKSDWNGRLFTAGNGSFAGFIRYDGLIMGTSRGYASASTNTGHRTTERNWSIDHPKRVENYSHRAEHLVAVNAKTIVAAFYGMGPRHSYFLGCSGGGMQGLNEAQLYPADYDGVVAGAGGQSIAAISARRLESALYSRGNSSNTLTRGEWDQIAAYAVALCDKDDGLVDGIISLPERCQAKVANVPGLSAEKRAIAERLLGPARGADGEILSAAFAPGAAYQTLDGPGLAGEAFAQWLYNDPNWDFAKFDAARDIPRLEALFPGLSYTNPNLTAFARRGGKLITTHGWTDPIVPTGSTLDYYQKVQRFMGKNETARFFRMFLAPGVNHCGEGAGPDLFTMAPNTASPIADPDHDLLEAVVRWVESGQPPEQVIASKIKDGKVVMTRPVCAYPGVVRYRGAGDVARAENFECVKP